MAALTEPLAVGVHAVAKSKIAKGDAALVIGLGPVGLACIAAMKMLGLGPVIGADFSPPAASWPNTSVATKSSTRPSRRRSPRGARIDGVKPLVVFEAVGVPGMIEQTMRMAPKDARVLIVGACMQEDTIHPMLGITKELNLQFVLGYQPDEFAASLDAIANERVDLAPLLTGVVDIDGVPQAFVDLGNPEAHAKILVEP